MIYKIKIKTTIEKNEISGWNYNGFQLTFDKDGCISIMTDKKDIVERLESEIKFGLKIKKSNKTRIIFPSMFNYFEVIHID